MHSTRFPRLTDPIITLVTTQCQFGENDYVITQDLGRTPMKVTKSAAPVEQLTMDIQPEGGNRGVLKITWADVEATVNLTAH